MFFSGLLQVVRKKKVKRRKIKREQQNEFGGREEDSLWLFLSLFIHTFLPFGKHLRRNFNDEIVALYCTVLKDMVLKTLIMLTVFRC